MIYEFIPTQSYNGYEKPWGPGEGVNLISPLASLSPITVGELTITPFEDGHFHISKKAGTLARGSNMLLAEEISVTPSVYMATFADEVNSSLFCALRVTSGGSNVISTTAGGPAVVSIQTATAKYLHISATADAVFEGDIFPIAISGEAPEAWSPYANICPIQGFDIWDPIEQQMVQVYAGYVNSNTLELYLRPVYGEYAGEELVGPWLSSLDEDTEEGTPTTGAQVVDLGGELTTFQITPFMLQTLLDSMGIRTHFTSGAGMLNKLMDQAQGRVRTEEELLHMSNALRVIPIGEQLPSGLKIKPITKDVLPGLPGKYLM